MIQEKMQIFAVLFLFLG